MNAPWKPTPGNRDPFAAFICDEAALDIRDLRSLVDCIRLVRRTAMQTAVRMITTGVMLALLAGIAIKLKIFRGSP